MAFRPGVCKRIAKHSPHVQHDVPVYTQIAIDQSKVGQRPVDIIFCHSPILDIGYFLPQQVAHANRLHSLTSCMHCCQVEQFRDLQLIDVMFHHLEQNIYIYRLKGVPIGTGFGLKGVSIGTAFGLKGVSLGTGFRLKGVSIGTGCWAKKCLGPKRLWVKRCLDRNRLGAKRRIDRNRLVVLYIRAIPHSKQIGTGFGLKGVSVGTGYRLKRVSIGTAFGLKGVSLGTGFRLKGVSIGTGCWAKKCLGPKRLWVKRCLDRNRLGAKRRIGRNRLVVLYIELWNTFHSLCFALRAETGCVSN